MRLVAITTAVVLSMVLSASATPYSQKYSNKSFRNSVELIPGGSAEPGQDLPYLAGIRLRLDKGWKTYWRYPGDSGIPPAFDWSDSRNLKSIKVLYPAPRRFADLAGDSIGYKNEVIFPLLVEPERKSEPVRLRLSFDYGICKDICVPEQAKLRFDLVPYVSVPPAELAVLSGFLKSVPKKVSLGSKTEPVIKIIKAQLSGASPHLFIEASFAAGAVDRELFIEAGDEHYIPMAEKLPSGQDKITRFRADLKTIDDPKTLLGKPLIFTLVSSSGHSEMSWLVKQQPAKK